MKNKTTDQPTNHQPTHEFTTKIENEQEFSRIAYFGPRGETVTTWYPTENLPYLSGKASFWRI